MVGIESPRNQNFEDPIVLNPNIFPVGAAAAQDVRSAIRFSKYTREEIFSGANFDMQIQNSDAYDLLCKFARKLGDESEKTGAPIAFMEGVAFAYAVFQERAGNKTLPTLTSDFVEHYDAKHDAQDKGFKPPESIHWGRVTFKIPRHRSLPTPSELAWMQQVNLFIKTEKAFYNTIVQGQRRKSFNPYTSPYFAGIVHATSLFKAGFSNYDNYMDAKYPEMGNRGAAYIRYFH